MAEKELTAQEWFERAFYATDLDEKVELYSQAIVGNPDYASALYNRALARYNKGNLDAALKDYSEAIRLKPDDTDALYGRSLVRYDKGDLDGARRRYEQAARYDPDRGVAQDFLSDLDKMPAPRR